MTKYALLQINKYSHSDWGVHEVFQTTKLEIAEAMKAVKEDAHAEEQKVKDKMFSTPTVYKIIELDS